MTLKKSLFAFVSAAHSNVVAAILLVGSSFFFTGCSSGERRAEVELYLPSAYQLVYWGTWGPEGYTVTDSLHLKRGRGRLAFSLDEPRIIPLSSDGRNFSVILVLKPGERVRVYFENNRYRVEGSQESVRLNGYQQLLQQETASIVSLRNSFICPDSVPSSVTDSLRKRLYILTDSVVQRVRRVAYTYVKHNPYWLSSAMVLTSKLADSIPLLPFGTYSELYLRVDSALWKQMPDNPFVHLFHRFMGELQRKVRLKQIDTLRSRVSTYIPTITFTAADSLQYFVPGIRARYVLLDFWTSRPFEIYNRNNLYNNLMLQYGKQGLKVVRFGIAVPLDSVVSLANSDTLGIVYASIPDMNGWGIADTLGVATLPANIIVSRWGRIVGTDWYGTMLIKRIDSLFSRRVKPVSVPVQREKINDTVPVKPLPAKILGIKPALPRTDSVVRTDSVRIK